MKFYELKKFKTLFHIDSENYIIRFYLDTGKKLNSIKKEDDNLSIIFAIYFPVKFNSDKDKRIKLNNKNRPSYYYKNILTTESNIFYKIQNLKQ